VNLAEAKISLLDLARAYIGKIPGAVSGSGGHNQTFVYSCEMIRGGKS